MLFFFGFTLKTVHYSSGLILITTSDTSNHSRVIRKLLKVATLYAVAEVSGVQGKKGKERGQFLVASCLHTHLHTEAISGAEMLFYLTFINMSNLYV